MHAVVPGLLWTGNARDARDPHTLFDSGIAAVVDLAYEESPAELPRQFVYCRFPLFDGAGNDLQLLRMAVDTVVNLLATQTSTLVACSAGMSRSPTIAAIALSVHQSEPPEQTLESLAELNNTHDVSVALWNDVLRACDLC